MMPRLFAAFVPAAVLFLAPPQLPAPSGTATVGVRIDSTYVAAENFSDNPRWIVFSHGSVHITSAVAPHSEVVWSCTEDCLWEVTLQVADTDGGTLHVSQSVSLYAALGQHGDALWFGLPPGCWIESNGTVAPYFDSPPANLMHTPVVRPSHGTGGDTPPPIDNKPLPPI